MNNDALLPLTTLEISYGNVIVVVNRGRPFPASLAPDDYHHFTSLRHDGRVYTLDGPGGPVVCAGPSCTGGPPALGKPPLDVYIRRNVSGTFEIGERSIVIDGGTKGPILILKRNEGVSDRVRELLTQEVDTTVHIIDLESTEDDTPPELKDRIIIIPVGQSPSQS